jgi:hypothetical protein
MGLIFSIPQEAEDERAYHVWGLCNYLTKKVMDPFCARDGGTWDNQFKDFFIHDPSQNPFDPTGVIIFTPPALFEGQFGALETAIKTELEQLHIKTAPFKYVRHQHRRTIKSIRIPIIENPNALNGPPEVSMSKTVGCYVLRDLLGCIRTDGRYEIKTSDVLEKVSNISEEQIQAICKAPVMDTKSPARVRRVSSPFRTKAIQRCIHELSQLALWAAKHHYDTLVAA